MNSIENIKSKNKQKILDCIIDNNLMYLEAIHNFVEVLNEYFHNVCELDLVFNFYKVSSQRFY